MISRASRGRHRCKSTVNDYARNKKLPRNIRTSLPLDSTRISSCWNGTLREYCVKSSTAGKRIAPFLWTLAPIVLSVQLFSRNLGSHACAGTTQVTWRKSLISLYIVRLPTCSDFLFPRTHEQAVFAREKGKRDVKRAQIRLVGIAGSFFSCCNRIKIPDRHLRCSPMRFRVHIEKKNSRQLYRYVNETRWIIL